MTASQDDRGIDELTLDVTRAAGRLAGSAEAAAVLESMGVGDERARRLDRASVFRLAAEVAELQDRSPAAGHARRAAERERRAERLARSQGDIAMPAARSVALAVPLVAPALAIPLLTASLWTGGRPEAYRATAIGIAVAASFVAVAGFVLAMAAVGGGRRTGAVARSTLLVAGAGLAAAVVGGLTLWAVLSWKDFVAPGEVGTALEYFASLAALWLATGLAIAAGRTGWVLIALAIGIGVAAGMEVGLGTSQVAAHQAGILTAAVLASLAAFSAAREGRQRLRTPPAPWSTVAALGLLGTALGGMLFADRVATWYSQSPPHSFILALRPDAELGWDCAVVAVFGAIALAVAAARRFGADLAGIADRSPLTTATSMSDEVRGRYRRSVARMVLAAVLGAAAILVAVLVLMAVWIPFADVVSRTTAYVVAIVGPGLVLLAWGSFNAAILVAMGSLGHAVLAAWIGLVVDVAVALPLAVHADGWTAAAGLAAGAVAFLVVTLFGVRRVLRNPDLAFATRS